MNLNEEEKVEEHPFYEAIRDRIDKRRQNVLILIVGDPGTGKSLLALKIANKIDPTFTEDNIRERVVCQAEQFSELIAADGESTLPKGSAVIIDEAGASVGSRDWYSIGNKMVSHIMQTFRYRQLVVIMTVPNMSFIDIHVRKLINFLVETSKIDFGTGRTKARVWELTFNKISGDGTPYRKRFRKVDEFGETVVLDYMWFKKCDCKIVHAYEKYSFEFKQKIAEKALRSITRIREKDTRNQFDPKEIAMKVLNNKDRYYKGKNINRALVQTDFGIGGKRVVQVVSIIPDVLRDIEIATHTDSNYNKIKGNFQTDTT